MYFLIFLVSCLEWGLKIFSDYYRVILIFTFFINYFLQLYWSFVILDTYTCMIIITSLWMYPLPYGYPSLVWITRILLEYAFSDVSRAIAASFYPLLAWGVFIIHLLSSYLCLYIWSEYNYRQHMVGSCFLFISEFLPSTWNFSTFTSNYYTNYWWLV